MRLIGYGIALALVVLALVNYSDKQGEPEGVIPEPYERSLDKAQQLEKNLQDSTQERLRSLESAED